jgi:hypothetical protein
VETLPATEEEVSKIQLLKIKPQIELVEEKVKTVEIKIHVRITKLKMGIEPLVAAHVETKEIIIEEINV